LLASVALALAVPSAAHANRSEVKSFDIGQEVTAIAVTKDGSAIWFCQAWAEQIGRLDTATGAVRTWPIPSKTPDPYTSGGQPYDILVDDAGDVWFNELPGRAGGGPAFVTRFAPATETFQQFQVNGGWWNGYGGDIWLGQGGLAKGPDGKIWYSDNSRAEIVGWIDPATGEQRTLHVGAYNWGAPTSIDVAVSSTGKAYVGNEGIALVDPATGALTQLPGFGTSTLGTADAFGNVWFSATRAEDGAQLPVRIGDDGSVTWFPEVPEDALPGWFGQMAADSLGHVWIPRDPFSNYNSVPGLLELDPWTRALKTYDFPFRPEYVSINGGWIAASRSGVVGPGQIALVLDLDRDGDGVLGKLDCNDRDASVFPGAVEVKHDGVDQDCNGYDLTIEVTRATYHVKSKLLRVEATSDLGSAAALVLTGFGPMKWDAASGRWVLTVSSAAANPGSVKVCGVEGCDFPVAVTLQ
jgi:streptogramin lyase